MTTRDQIDIEEIDVEAWGQTHGNQRLPHARRFRIRIDEDQLVVHNPVITGRALLEAAGKSPVAEYLISLVLRSGQFEDIRLDETVDLQRPGVERFLTWRSDRSFRFVIDGRRFEWGAPYITGLKLKELAGVDPATYGVWLEVPGAEDRPIADTEAVDLQQPGIERFFTGKTTTTEG